MPEDVARAVGANGGTTINIAGKECTVRPLGVAELCELERICLETYKRQYLKTFSENLDLLPENERVGLLTKKFDEVAKFDLADLPNKNAHDPRIVKLTDKLKKWVADNYTVKDTMSDYEMSQLVVSALDSGMLEASKYKELTGNNTPAIKVPYVSWWPTGCFDGMVTMIWVCFRNNGVTREEVIEALGKETSLLTLATREIEKLSTPEAGNG